jgi:hypothetical protein
MITGGAACLFTTLGEPGHANVVERAFHVELHEQRRRSKAAALLLLLLRRSGLGREAFNPRPLIDVGVGRTALIERPAPATGRESRRVISSARRHGREPPCPDGNSRCHQRTPKLVLALYFEFLSPVLHRRGRRVVYKPRPG